jgi:hypothetical protein
VAALSRGTTAAGRLRPLKRRPFVTQSVRMLAAALALAMPASIPVAASAQDAVPGHVSVARVTDDALIIWDASPEVAGFVTNKTPDAQANAQLRHDALRVAAANFSKLEKTAKSVTIRVIYNKTGAVSPVYHAETFAGVVRYATLEFPYKDAAGDSKWKSLDAKSSLPGWMKFTVLDKLPPSA